MHVLITRPEPDSAVWRAHLEARGITVSSDAMLQIAEEPPACLDLTGVQALIATSRNSLRWLGACPNLSAVQGLPIYTVGPGSTKAAAQLGFERAEEGAGTARDLVALIAQRSDPDHGALLHISGDRIAFDLAAALEPMGFVTQRRVVYHSRPAYQLRPSTVAGIASGAIDTVALLSPLSADTFVRLAREAGLEQHHQRLVYVCLSENIAGRMRPLSPGKVVVAAQPNAEAVLALLEKLAVQRSAC